MKALLAFLKTRPPDWVDLLFIPIALFRIVACILWFRVVVLGWRF
jgi:hypothetical protein